MPKEKIFEFKRAIFGKVRKMLLECDAAIEVADARNIAGTRIKKLDRPFASKVIIAAAKCDLAPGPFPKYSDRIPVIPFSSRTKRGKEELLAALRGRRDQMNQSRILHGKQPLPEIRACVFGIPNVGKSSLINVISNRKGAKTGFKAGVTTNVQWISLGGGILLYDTPGVINLEENDEQLALKASLDVEKLSDPQEAALILIARCLSSKNPTLFSHFGIAHSTDPDSILESIARKRGLLLKKGEPNISEASKIIVREYQKGKFSS